MDYWKPLGVRTEVHDCELVPLHELPEFKRKSAFEYCCYILNREWPVHGYKRRELWLQESNPGFPHSLVMFSPESRFGPERRNVKGPKKNQPVMVGHCRICKVEGEDDSCYIGSVIIDPDWRGHGYGRKLMELTERYALEVHGFKRAYLDIENPQLIPFYTSLGYERDMTSFRDPVVPIDTQDPSTCGEWFTDILKEYSPVTIMRDVCEWVGALLPEGVCDCSGGDAAGPLGYLSTGVQKFLNSSKQVYWVKNFDCAGGDGDAVGRSNSVRGLPVGERVSTVSSGRSAQSLGEKEKGAGPAAAPSTPPAAAARQWARGSRDTVHVRDLSDESELDED